MSNKLKILLAILIIGIISAVIMWKWVYAKADVSVGNRKADIKIETSALLNRFETNEDSANKLYLNKIILVSGPIDNFIKNEQGISVYLKNKGDASGVVCSFDNSAIDTSSLKSGEIIKVKGICTGYLMDAVLSKCSLEK